MTETKKLSALDATLLVMGGIIGVGIFFTPAQIASSTPHPAAFLSLWAFGGVIAMAAAFTFAELGARYPASGGWFVYLREGFGRFPAFLFAWVVLFIVSTGATAAVAMFCGSQLAIAFPGWFGSVPDAVLGAAVVGLITAIGLCGVKRAALAQNLCMAVKLLALFGLIVCGVVFVGGGADEGARVTQAAAGASTGEEGSLLSGWLSALLPTFFAYGGWQMVAYIAPEVRDPARVLPRAIVLGVLGVVAVYLALNLSLVLGIGVDGLAGDASFASGVAERAFGERGQRVLAAAIAVSALGWCVVNIITAPWLYVAMAREGLFFESIGRVHPRRGVPVAALLVQAAVTLGYLCFTLDFLVDAVVFVEWVFHGLVAVALLRLRRSPSGSAWPYRSPLYPAAPIVYAGAAAIVVGSTLWSAEWQVRGTGIAVVALGSVAYVLWTRLRPAGRGASSTS